MRRYLSHALFALNVLLAGLLLSMWVDRTGALRNTRWVPPAAIKPDFVQLLYRSSTQSTDDVARYVAMLDRPLFSPSRRPPPPPPPPVVVVPPPPDPLANVQILGVFNGTEGSGMVARVDGKVRRLKVTEKIGDWTFDKVDGRDVTFARGSERRVIRLAPARPGTRG